MKTVASLGPLQARLELALEAAELGTWTWDRASGLTEWDVRLEELHGLAPGEFGGTFDDWVAALHPEDRAECLARVQAALENPGPYSLLHRTIRPDGTIRWIECRGRVLVDDAGVPSGTVGVAIDVTARERRDEAVNRALAEEQRLVETLQRALLPGVLPTVAGVTIASRYIGASRGLVVGGDWYAVVPVRDSRIGIAIGDVAGHGLPAVAEMAEVRFALRAIALAEQRPERVLDRLNEVVQTFDHERMVTTLYGIVDPLRRRWSFANAGHCPAIVHEPGRGARFLDFPARPPIGIVTEYETHSVDLAPNSTLVLYTDGLIERRSASIEDGMAELLSVCEQAGSGVRADDPEAWCTQIVSNLLDHAGDDDVAVVVVHID